jgi:hypothetical protein
MTLFCSTCRKPLDCDENVQCWKCSYGMAVQRIKELEADLKNSEDNELVLAEAIGMKEEKIKVLEEALTSHCDTITETTEENHQLIMRIAELEVALRPLAESHFRSMGVQNPAALSKWVEIQVLRIEREQARGAVSEIITFCPECGPNVTTDEDGCCLSCGAAAMGAGVEKLRARIAALEEFFRWVFESVQSDSVDAWEVEREAIKLGLAEMRLAPPDSIDARLYGPERELCYIIEPEVGS